MNVHDYRKQKFDMDDFMNHLKGLICEVEREFGALTNISACDSPAYRALYEFAGIDDEWLDSNKENLSSSVYFGYKYSSKGKKCNAS